MYLYLNLNAWLIKFKFYVGNLLETLDAENIVLKAKKN